LLKNNRCREEVKNLTFFKADDSLPNVVDVLGNYRAIESVPLLIQLKGKGR
jgi:hypothetical protein